MNATTKATILADLRERLAWTLEEIAGRERLAGLPWYDDRAALAEAIRRQIEMIEAE